MPKTAADNPGRLSASAHYQPIHEVNLKGTPMHSSEAIRSACSVFILATALIAAPAFADENPAKTEGSKTKAGAHGSGGGSGHALGKSSGGEESPRKAEGSSGKTADAPHKEGSSGYGSAAHGGSGYARAYGHHAGHDPFRHVLAFAKELALTEEQTAAIKDQRLEYEKSKIRNEAEHQIAHLELEKLLHSENVDEAKIRELAGKIGDLIDGMIKTGIEAKLTAMRILTPEQRKKVNRMFSEHD
jgi:Spy/CpxP family protein refolding chaperone